MIPKELLAEVEKYAEKHDLKDDEKVELVDQLAEDISVYGNAYLHSEKGRVKPTKVSTGLE